MFNHTLAVYMLLVNVWGSIWMWIGSFKYKCFRGFKCEYTFKWLGIMLMFFLPVRSQCYIWIYSLLICKLAYCHLFLTCNISSCNISSRFSKNSEAFASEFLENIEEIMYRYYMCIDVCGMIIFITTRYCATRSENVWKIHMNPIATGYALLFCRKIDAAKYCFSIIRKSCIGLGYYETLIRS